MDGCMNVQTNLKHFILSNASSSKVDETTLLSSPIPHTANTRALDVDTPYISEEKTRFAYKHIDTSEDGLKIVRAYQFGLVKDETKRRRIIGRRFGWTLFQAGGTRLRPNPLKNNSLTQSSEIFVDSFGKDFTFSRKDNSDSWQLAYSNTNNTDITLTRPTHDSWLLSIGKDESYYFDSRGLAIAAEINNKKIIYKYNKHERLTKISTQGNADVSFTYNQHNLVSSILISNNIQISYNYDRLRRLREVIKTFSDSSRAPYKEHFFYEHKGYPYLITVAKKNGIVIFETRISEVQKCIEIKEFVGRNKQIQ